MTRRCSQDTPGLDRACIAIALFGLAWFGAQLARCEKQDAAPVAAERSAGR